MDDLLSRLRACVADESEIPLLFQSAATGGTRVTKSGAVECISADHPSQLLATLREKDGRVTRVTPGPALATEAEQDSLVKQFAIDAAPTHGTVVSTRVLFSMRPLKGMFTWNNWIRISPCPKRAPIGKGLDWFARASQSYAGESHLGPPYPFILEVKSFGSPNSLLQDERARRNLDTYQYLFTLLLNGRIRYAYLPSERQWTSVMRRRRVEYHLLYPGFSPGIGGSSSHFVRRRTIPAPIYSGPVDYYNHLWGRDEELFLPPSLSQDLTTVETLSTEESRSFKRACYWYSLGVQMTSEPSLSTVAFTTAIECLLPSSSGPSCTSCGKPTGAGPTAKFREHVKRYGTVPRELEAQRNAIYTTRSTLVHGSQAHRADDGFFSLSESRTTEFLTEIVAQRSLIGWLRDPNRSLWQYERPDTYDS